MLVSSQKILTKKKNKKHGQKWDINNGEEQVEKLSRSKTHGRNNTIRTGEIKDSVYKPRNLLVLLEYMFQEMKDKKRKVVVQIPASQNHSLHLIHVPIHVCCWEQNGESS